jgi:hypothetical protein
MTSSEIGLPVTSPKLRPTQYNFAQGYVVRSTT